MQKMTIEDKYLRAENVSEPGRFIVYKCGDKYKIDYYRDIKKPVENGAPPKIMCSVGFGVSYCQEIPPADVLATMREYSLSFEEDELRKLANNIEYLLNRENERPAQGFTIPSALNTLPVELDAFLPVKDVHEDYKKLVGAFLEVINKTI